MSETKPPTLVDLAALDAAACGELWEVGPYPGHVRVVGTPRLVAACRGYSSNIHGERVDAENEANARFIAAIKNAAPRLLAQLRALADKHQGFADRDVDREDVTGRIIAAVHNGFASELRTLLGEKA